MDADDISLPHRLEKQVTYMESHPDVGVAGSWLECFGDKIQVWDYPADPAILHAMLLFHNQLGHPTVIMRRELMARHGLFYNPDYKEAEDYELWTRCTRFFLLGNLPEVLLMYRWHEKQASQANLSQQQYYHGRVCRQELNRLGINATDEELSLHLAIGFREFETTEDLILAMRQWLHRLWEANLNNSYYQQTVFINVLEEQWRKVSVTAGIDAGRLFD